MTPEQQEQLAQTIKQRRQELGLSASEVARRAGVQKTTITRLEAAQRQTPQADSLKAIARVLGLQVTDLFVAADWLPKGELPTLRPYLRSQYRGLPDDAMAELEESISHIVKKHGYNGSGPAPGEDEI